MSTNIFDFQNSESSMQFNPLFLPANTFADNPGSVKSFKISNSSYLFSDIIKVFTGASLVKNSDLNINLTSQTASGQVPSENIFSFNLADNNNLHDLGKVLNNSKFSSISLKEIIALLSQLFKAGQNNSIQEGISLNTDNSLTDKVLNGDGLKSLLNELSNLFNNTDAEGSSSKEKIKPDKDTKEIISKIFNSLSSGAPVLINIIGKNETLKIELTKTGNEAAENKPGTVNYKSNFINGVPNENETYADSNKLTNGEAAKENMLNVSAEQIEQNPNEISTEPNNQNLDTVSEGKANQNSNTLFAEQAKTNYKPEGSDKVEKLFAELDKKQTKVIKDNEILSADTKNKTELPDQMTISRKTSGSLKIFNNEQNTADNDFYKLKLEIVDNEKNTQSIKNHPDLSNAADQVRNSSLAAKDKSDSLTIENLVASKSSLKNISKLSNQAETTAVKPDENIKNVKIEIQNTPGETKSNSKNLNSVSLKPESDIKIDNETIKHSDYPGKINLDGEKTDQGSGKSASIKNDMQKSVKAEYNGLNKVNADNPGNPEKAVKDTNLNTKVSEQIKAAGTDTKSVNHKDTVSNSHLSDNLKVDNSAKINPNNSPENNFGDNLSNSKQDLSNNSKGQEQIPSDRGENAFSSYLNKTDANIIQNSNRSAYLNNLTDQMKTIDSNEIVNEISKLASDKDQKNIVLKLVPETLGKVKIMLDISNNIIHAHAEVENEAAKSLMQNNLGNLKQALAQQGMQLNSLNISLSNNQEQKSNRSYLSKRKFSYSEPQIGEIDENEHTNVSKHYGYNTYEYLA